jgi:2,5-diketo-D-gluconate reductase A
MRERGVQIESWGPFAEGKNNLFTDPTLSEIGAAHGKSVAQVVCAGSRSARLSPSRSPSGRNGCGRTSPYSTSRSPTQMARIAALDTGASLFFDHRDPAMVSWLNGRADD